MGQISQRGSVEIGHPKYKEYPVIKVTISKTNQDSSTVIG